MPHFYFDLQSNDYFHDVDGIELASIADAENEALRVLLDAAVDLVRERFEFDHRRPVAVTMRCGTKPAFKATLSIAVNRFK